MASSMYRAYNEAVRQSFSGRCQVTGVISPCEQVCCNLTIGDEGGEEVLTKTKQQ